MSNDREPWEHAAEEGHLADAIEGYLRHSGTATFAELHKRLGGYFDLEGTCEISMLAPNVIVWANMSDAFAEAIDQLAREERIFPVQSDALAYTWDRKVLALPIATRLRPEGYTTPHWLPIALTTEPPKPARPGRTAKRPGRE